MDETRMWLFSSKQTGQSGETHIILATSLPIATARLKHMLKHVYGEGTDALVDSWKATATEVVRDYLYVDGYTYLEI